MSKKLSFWGSLFFSFITFISCNENSPITLATSEENIKHITEEKAKLKTDRLQRGGLGGQKHAIMQ